MPNLWDEAGYMSTQAQWDEAAGYMSMHAQWDSTTIGLFDPLESAPLQAGAFDSTFNFADDPSMRARRGSRLLTLLPTELLEQIAFVLQAEKSTIRASCRYFRDMVDRMATSLEVRQKRPLPRIQRGQDMDIVRLPVRLLARCPNITRVDLSGGCDDCFVEPSFVIPGSRPFRCKELQGPMEPGMEDMHGGRSTSRMVRYGYKPCDYPGGCSTKPSYGMPGIGPTSCQRHKKPGMVHGVIRDRAHTLLAQRECVLVEDLTPLNELPRLREIVCINTRVRDLAPLAAMTTLRSLNCCNTRVIDLTPLAALTTLQCLDCSGTAIMVLSPLTSLKSLRSLNCSGTLVADLSPLSALTALRSLDCSSIRLLVDLSPVSTFTALECLDCSDTSVRLLTPVVVLLVLGALQSLDCSFNIIYDLSPLASLTSLRSLNCSRTRVTDLSPMAGLTALQCFDCSQTRVNDVSPLTALTALRSLNCSNTLVSDLSPLAGLAPFLEITS